MKRISSLCSSIFPVFFIFTVLLGLQQLSLAAPPLQAPQASGPRIWLGESQPAALAKTGAFAPGSALLKGTAPSPVSLASADLDGDGVADLVVGYNTGSSGLLSIQRGNLDAFAPQSTASFLAIGHGQFPSPFQAVTQTVVVPVHPDFVVTGDFNGDGHPDVAAAARGGSELYVFMGDGKGGLSAPQAVSLAGTVTTLAAGNLGRAQLSSLLVGLSDPKTGFSLDVYGETSQGFAQSADFSLSATASNVLFGDFGDAGDDAAFLSGGDVMVLHAASMQLEQISLPVSASAMALGYFIYDRNAHIQIALLSSDGSVHVAAHSEFDPHRLSVAEMQAIRKAVRNGEPNPIVPPPGVAVNGWKIVESIPAAASFPAGQTPIFFRTRISDNGADDLMVLDGAAGQMEVISHADSAPDAPDFQPAQISTRPYTGSPVAALAMRTNIDGRPGVVALHAGQLAPMVMMPLPDPTFTVNRTDDPTPVSPISGACNGVPNDCSLREAVLKANAVTGGDTIMVPAGTFTLTRGRAAAPAYDAQTGTLNINDTVTITGAGQNSTIITWGTPVGGPVDMVMAVNEDITILSNATASISNLTIQNGINNGTHGNDGDGGCMEFDTGTSGTANLTLTSVTLQGCSTTHGNGGGIALFNFLVNGSGLASFSSSIIQNNSAVDSTAGVAATGGGIWVSSPARMSMSNSQVLNNSATQVNGSVAGEGGGITITNRVTSSRQTVIQNSTISGNHAAGNGGGIHDESNLSISLTSITSNLAGTANLANAQDGGGLFLNTPSNGCPLACTDSVSLQSVTITGNSATLNGGGIAAGNSSGAGPLTMNFSRLAGNSAPNGKNLSNNSTTASVTDNWWGTNSPSTAISTVGTGTTTFDPFIVLTHTPAQSAIKINTSTILTADISKDNHGAAIAVGNLTELIGLPITFSNAVLGTIPNAQPETIGANGTATATFNAGGVSGNGHADATVDQATVTANIVVLEPLQIAKNFNPTTVAVNASSTLTFSVTNPNVIAVDANFTDTFPTGLVVAATPGVTNTCGGTVTATAGSGSVSFSNAALPVGSCSITVKVSSAVDSVYNNSVTINSTAAGTGAATPVSLTVINPPSIAKAFGAATVPLNGTTSLTFTLSSTNTTLTLNGISFTDGLPAGLIVAATPNLSNTCGGTATAVGGSSSVSLIGASLAPGASCTVSVSIQGTTAGVKNNSVQASSTNGGTGNTSNASITVVGPPVIIKAFGAGSIPLNSSTSLTFTIQNNNTTVALTGVAFSDTLPAGLVIATPNGLAGSCGAGTITDTAGTSVISLSGGSIAASSSCTFSVNVTGTAAGTQNNTTGNVTSTEGGTGGTASASINVLAPPSIAKVFNPAAIAVNATTSLTFTITNPAANALSLTGVAFTDTLPTGLTVANASATVCGGTVTTTAPTGISLSGATIAANSQCQFSVTVTGAASGSYTNTTGNVTSTNGGTGNTASANLTVATPPTITKAFGAASIPLNGTTSLTFNITNPNTGLSLTGLAFTDNLPAGLVVAPTPGISNTCGGTVTATAGASSVSLSAGTLASSASCSVSVTVQGTIAGIKNNSVQVTSTEAGAGNTSNASITVIGPPVIIKAFGTASIPLNGSTSLTFTIQNNNTTSTLTGISFSDTLPAGLIVSTPDGLTGTCGGGTIIATAGSGSVSLSGASLAASSSCTFSVNVTGTAAGTQNNTTGNVTSTEGGTGGTASASINVVAPPSIAKVFNPSGIALNATTSLTFTITNPAANAVSLTGVAFTDTLPTGLTVANASATVCGGTLTTTAPTGISLSGATIAANSQCQFSITVTGAAAGSYTNTTGNVTSTNGGTGNAASASLSVATPPSISKAFGAASILLNGSTSLSFTINNPNGSVALTGVAFADTLPAGLVAATPNALTSTCGGTVTAAAGSGSVTLAGGTLAANGSCSISLNVTGVAAGVENNTTGAVSAAESGPGATSNTASITVIAPPSITKAFGAASIQLNATTTLSFTITNPNATVAMTGVAFTDTLPAGLAISSPNGLTGSCGTGTITTSATSASLSAGTIAAAGSCAFSVNVTGTASGHKINTTGTVISTNAGSGNQATATIDVNAPDLAITKTHVGTFTRGQTGAQYTITVSNVGFGPTVGTVTVVDTLPNIANTIVPTAISGTGWTCTLATLTCTRTDALASGGSYPPITMAVNVPINIQNTFTNTATVSGGGDVNPNNNTATDTVSLGPPIVLTPQSTSVTVSPGGTALMAISVDVSDPTLGTITFACSGLPRGSLCRVNPGSIDAATTPSPSTLTVSIFTTQASASLSAPARPGPAGRLPLYAMLSVPVFGMVLAGFGGTRKKGITRWRVLALLGLALLLGMVGCGSNPHSTPIPGTPPGTSTITVTATSTAFTATTTYDLVVQ